MKETHDKHESILDEKPSKVLSKRIRMLNSSEFKRQVFYALENMQQGKLLTKIVGGFLFLLIVANAVLVFLMAQPDLDPFTTTALDAFFVFSTICFFIEYVCRVWVSDLAYGNCTRARARLKYIFSGYGIVDFLSFAPSMLSWFLPVNATIIRVINLIRLIRLVKVTRYMRGFRTMGRVLSKHYQEIVASFLVIIGLALVASLIMYEVEHAAQPEAFNSLFQGIWYAVQTVTSTGYGDIVPVTTTGKVCGMVIMMLSLGLVAIPGGIFSAGFVAEFQNANMRKIERDVKRNRHDDSKSKKSDDDSHAKVDHEGSKNTEAGKSQDDENDASDEDHADADSKPADSDAHKASGKSK